MSEEEKGSGSWKLLVIKKMARPLRPGSGLRAPALPVVKENQVKLNMSTSWWNNSCGCCQGEPGAHKWSWLPYSTGVGWWWWCTVMAKVFTKTHCNAWYGIWALMPLCWLCASTIRHGLSVCSLNQLIPVWYRAKQCDFWQIVKMKSWHLWRGHARQRVTLDSLWNISTQ